MWGGSMRDRCRVDEGWIGEGSMCAGCAVDIGSIMSKKERRESENLFFFFKERASLPYSSILCAICAPRTSEPELVQFVGQCKRLEVELALIPRNMNQLMMNTFLTIDKKYN